MKIIWSLDYLNKKMSPRQIHEWTIAKRAQLAQKTGIRWSRQFSAGKLIFNPILDFQAIEEISDPQVIEEFKEAYKKSDPFLCASYVKIAENLNTTNYRVVLGIAKHLIMIGEAVPHVDRRGASTYIKLKRTP